MRRINSNHTSLKVKDLLIEKVVPVVAIDEHGLFFHVNTAFEKKYGWSKNDLIGNLITLIMPPHMRDAHNSGFSRFLMTEESKIQEIPIPLPVFCKNGKVENATHFIVGEKKNGKWRFAASITPLD